jgi:hypothetical protein
LKVAAAEVKVAAPVPFMAGAHEMPAPIAPARLATQRPAIATPGNGNDADKYLIVTREYAHAAKPLANGAPRSDFVETVYWGAHVLTDCHGEARVQFALCDSVTTFTVRADAVADNGALGEGAAAVEARRAFYIEPKLPLELTAGDAPRVPVVVVNGGERPVTCKVRSSAGAPLALAGDTPADNDVRLRGDERVRVVVPVVCGPVAGGGAATATFTVEGGTDSGEKDRVQREVQVVPLGFPHEQSAGGVLAADSAAKVLTLAMPASVVKNTLHICLTFATSPAASLQSAVAALLREPYGCFEQASSITFPNIMALQYFDSHAGAPPADVARARDFVERGYKRLAGYECKSGGFEWFGDRPGHEALTAFGLLEFTEMAKVYSGVDAAMVERTRKWLLGRRDGKGGYKRNSRALDSFGRASAEATNAYITWALAASKAPRAEIATEISALASLGRSSGDAYIVALAANALLEVGDAAAAAELVQRLGVMQDVATGEVKGATAAPSITGSTGKSLSIETTALAAAAMLSLDATVARGQRAYDFLVTSCSGGGRYGATQSTVLALRAILLADTRCESERRAGTLEVLLGDRMVHTQTLDPAARAPLIVNVPAADHPGDATGATTQDVSVRLRGGFDLPYVATAEWYDVHPNSDDGCALQLTTVLAPARVREGETTVATVTVHCRDAAALGGADGVAMSVAIIGVPGGLEARADQLRELRAEGRIDAYELRGREVVLYWRGLAAGSTHVVPLSLLAVVPGMYTGPASRAYVYYTDERKHWAAPMQVTVVDA